MNLNPSSCQPYNNRPVCEYLYNIKQLADMILDIVKNPPIDKDDFLSDIAYYINNNIECSQDAVNRMESRLYQYRSCIEDLGFVKPGEING